MTGRGLVIAGASSDAGKSLLTAGICRWLYRQGVKVAPFKAQNMSNNSVVVLDAPMPGSTQLCAGEIGRAQALQAAACGLEPSVRFNPILLKPSSDHSSQVIALGRAIGNATAGNFRHMQRQVRRIAFDTLRRLQTEFDVVICEGAGSIAEINLRDTDYVNMGLARETGWPVIVVGDIDRGGVFASLYGCLALLSPPDQELLAGFVINKFRGDPALLQPGLEQLEALTGRPNLGVIPWQLGLWLDSEDSLPAHFPNRQLTPNQRPLNIAVIRLPHISNATDFDPLAAEPGVLVEFTIHPNDVAGADLVIIPGSKSTVADLGWLRRHGLAEAIAAHAKSGKLLLGLCGGYQMLAELLHDEVESHLGTVPGLGLLPIEITFAADKTLAWSEGNAYNNHRVRGYEIHHGIVSRRPASLPELFSLSGLPEGARHHNVWGTHLHGLFENDDFRRAFLSDAAGLANRPDFQVTSGLRYATLREHLIEQLADLVERHLDTGRLKQLIDRGAPSGLPVVTNHLVPSSVYNNHQPQELK